MRIIYNFLLFIFNILNYLYLLGSKNYIEMICVVYLLLKMNELVFRVIL